MNSATYEMFHQAQADILQQRPDQGRWLCTEGPYQDYIAMANGLSPGIEAPDPKNKHVSSRVGQSRSVLLEMKSGDPWSLQAFNSATEIKTHFKERLIENSRESKESCYRIYILEGLAPDYVEAYGSYFFMDPRFFVRQERNDVWNLEELNFASQDSSFLPCLRESNEYFCIKYPEVRQFGPKLKDWRTTCAVTGRHIASIGFEGRLEGIGVLNRKFSFWSKEGSNGCWDVVILCDPPILEVHVPDHPKKSETIRNEPFQGGYPCFISHVNTDPNNSQLPEAPPRSSLLDDLCFYYTHYSRLLVGSKESQLATTPIDVTIFPIKIICSHYLKLIDYFEVILNRLAKEDWRLSRQSDYADWAAPAIEEQWSSLQLTRRRLSTFINDMEEIFWDMGIPYFDSTASSSHVGWKSGDKDFQYIYRKLQGMKNRVDDTLTSAIGLSNIVASRQALSEARRSVKEAKNTKTLTIVGLIFIPLAYTCALFSMTDQFSPGSKLFWVYFAVSIPLVILVFAGAFLIGLGYNDMGVWSYERFKRACSSRLFSMCLCP